jgi:hypothetical protein
MPIEATRFFQNRLEPLARIQAFGYWQECTQDTVLVVEDESRYGGFASISLKQSGLWRSHSPRRTYGA